MSFVLNKKFVNLRNFDIIILFSFDFKPFNNLKKLKTFLHLLTFQTPNYIKNKYILYE